MIDYIPIGKENAISRSMLPAVSGKTDREARRDIERARIDGEIIINTQNGAGYYKIDSGAELTPDEINDLRAQYKINRSRALAVLAQQKHIRKVLREAGQEV